MPAIWKYMVEVADQFEIEMPEGARVLCVQVQHDHPQIWAMVDPDAPMVTRRFRVVGTGHGIEAPIGPYVGTFQLYGGSFVGHLFEEGSAQWPGTDGPMRPRP